MKTVVIKVSELVAGQFPVRLYFDDGNELWHENHEAEWFITEGLVLKEEEQVNDPITKEDAPLDETSVRKFFSEDEEGYEDRFKAIGKFLYRLIFRGDVKTRWDDLRKQYGEGESSEGLRTILDVEPANLRALPWELMGDELSLFLDVSNPFSRGRIDFKTSVAKHMWPLRALIIIGSQQDDDEIDAELEAESIAGALREISRTIEVDIMRRPSKSNLAKQYKNLRPHIVHFIGHGGIDRKGPYLQLYDSKGNFDNWTIDDIANLRHTDWAASFAFINACRSGDQISAEGTWAIAEAFGRAKIPAVLSMLGDVEEEAAQTFAAGVYESLARNRPLDQAVAEARVQVSSCSTVGLGTKQWALASLFLAVPPDRVLAIDDKITPTFKLKIENDTEFNQLQAFVDRLEQRLAISKSVDPDPYLLTGNKSLLVVKGSTKIGKSWMVKLCLECCAMRGRKFSWVNAEKGESGSRTFLEVLRFIRDGDPLRDSLLCASLDEQGAFSHFNFELEHLLRSRGLMPDGSEIPPNYKESKKSKGTRTWTGSKENEVYLFSLFKEALQKAAGDVPLVIVLDNMEIEPGDFNKVLVPNLILPIRKNDVKNVKLILVLSQKNETEYDLSPLGHYETIVVSKFEKKDFVPLAHEFIRYKKNPYVLSRDDVKQIVDTWDKTAIGEYWGPEHLNTVFGWVEQAGRLRSS